MSQVLREGLDNHEAKEEVSLLFHVLGPHKDPGILNAVKKGKIALACSDIKQVQESIQQIDTLLRDWSIHPALANQLDIAHKAAFGEDHPQTGMRADRVVKNDYVQKRPSSSYPTL